MKRYKFEVVVDEGSDEFWEELEQGNKTGCDEVKEALEDMLLNQGWDVQIKLVQYSDNGN